MKKLYLILFYLILITNTIQAQNTAAIDSLILNGKEMINEAVNNWDPADMQQARAYFERLLSDTTYPWLIHYYIGYIDMRLFHVFFSEESKEEAKLFIENGIEHVEKAVEIKDDFGEGYALLSSLLGNKISLNPMLGMTLGMKSGIMISRAFKLAPENPRVSLIAGESAYYTPRIFGGGKEKAMENLKKAIEFFQTNQPQSSLHPSWGYDEAYAFKGMIHADWEQWEEAKNSYKKGLEINPHNGWISMNLLPNLEEKMNAE
ncbi:MAG: tetratricopeptide repeat protein [bacterium]